MNRVKPYLTILLGACILSFGLYNIHSQCGITEGGVLGTELLLQHWFGISPAISSFVLDTTCYLLGLRFLGFSFLKYAAVATLCYSASYALWEQFPPLLPDLSAFPLLAAVIGGLFVGIGVGLVVRIGGACGGDDALAMVISKLSKLPIAKCYLVTDVTVLLLSLSYIPIWKIACSLVTVTISSILIGKVQNWRLEPAPAN